MIQLKHRALVKGTDMKSQIACFVFGAAVAIFGGKHLRMKAADREMAAKYEPSSRDMQLLYDDRFSVDDIGTISA